MSSAHEFEEDAFISYRHLDNNFGWIDELHERLQYVLGELLGYPPKIWRDPRMPGNVYIAEHLEGRIKQTIVLISVLTPGYMNSAWCIGELKEFCRLAKENGGLEVNDKLRIFKIIKTFIEHNKHPEEVQRLTGYEFFEIDQTTNKPREFGTELGPNKDKRYWDKLNDLAWDIKQVLAGAKPQLTSPTAGGRNVFADKAVPASKYGVYLAETTHDLKDERDKIKRELQERGYDIFPDKELPYVSPDYEDAVRECLRRCKLSVHLIGESYGIIPDRANNRSIILLQNEIAAERSRQSGFRRLIWMPKGLKPTDDKHLQFIEYLKTSAAPQSGAELLQTSLEELKSLIQKKILSSNGHKPYGSPGRQVRKKIYLICDCRDAENIIPITECLSQKGYQVRLPIIDETADDSQAVAIHKDNLLQCDAILIYYGSANQGWFEYKLRDLEKIAGLEQTAEPERVKPLLATAIYIAGPMTSHKRLFSSFDPFTIKNFAEFSSHFLDEFLNQIEKSGEGEDNEGE